VDANSVKSLDFESSAFELVDEPAERGGSIGAREDVLVHEKTPDEILVLPALTQTSDLQEEDTIIVKHIINLLEETAKVADTDVLGHLQAGDLVVVAFGDGDITVVHAQDLALFLGDAGLAESPVAPGSLIATESNTSDLGAEVDAGEASKSAPTTADIKETLAGLEGNLLTDDGELVVL
jgi:hypothetical protein